MRGMNKVLLSGFIGADPMVKNTQDGRTVTTLSLCTTEVWNDKQTGERRERPEWHRLTFFNKPAEIIAQYCRKGDAIQVEGKLRTTKYTKDGQEHYSTSVHVDEFDFIMSKRDDNQAQGQNNTPNQARPQQAQGQAMANVAPVSSSIDDDIPF